MLEEPQHPRTATPFTRCRGCGQGGRVGRRWREIPSGWLCGRCTQAYDTAIQLEVDAAIFGVCFVKLTDNGPVRVDPREVSLDEPAS